MQAIVELAGITCKFIYTYQDITGGCWHWKLDPYITADKGNYDMIADLSGIDSDEAVFPRKDGLSFTEDAGFFRHQVFGLQDGGTVWRYVRKRSEKEYLSYTISPQWDQIVLLADHTQSAGALAFEYLGRIMPGFFLKHGILTFHGVLMEYKGQGFIISAPSGTGKTTHARLWRDHQDALIIDGDRAACCEKNGVWTGFGIPWSGTSGEQINRSVPLKALVVLERGSENEAHRIMNLEAFGALLPHLQYPRWDREMADKAVSGLEQILHDLPIIHLSCRPDPGSVEVLKDVLEKI